MPLFAIHRTLLMFILISTLEAMPVVAQQEFINSIDMKLVPIPAGRFAMGSPPSEEGSKDNETLHKVELTNPFHMSTTEVTEHQWVLVMESAYSTETVEESDPKTGRLIRKVEKQFPNKRLNSQRPVTDITWHQAVEFCYRLSQMPEEKRERRAYRLPTEAEWEYCCRAETMTAYFFGDDLARFSQFAQSPGETEEPLPVGSLEPNDWGLHDMHGNVWEWCQDWFSNYPNELVENPLGPYFGKAKVARGGSIVAQIAQHRAAARLALKANSAFSDLGFRVVVVEATDLEPKQKIISNSIGQKLIWVGPGGFKMGGGFEKPIHEVQITKGFYMGATEVTQKQWVAVMKTEPWQAERTKSWISIGPDYPAVRIDWEDADTFCKKLSELPNEKSAGRVYRLPTEAEWEYACRAGTETPFFFGDSLTDLKNYAWLSRFSREQEHRVNPVAQKKPNPWGFYDMYGNVGEICFDWFDEYNKELAIDPQGPEEGRLYEPELYWRKVVRGGDCDTDPRHCYSYSRGYMHGSGDNTTGLRVVLVAPHTTSTP